jgi:hypothetical protein
MHYETGSIGRESLCDSNLKPCAFRPPLFSITCGGETRPITARLMTDPSAGSAAESLFSTSQVLTGPAATRHWIWAVQASVTSKCRHFFLALKLPSWLLQAVTILTSIPEAPSSNFCSDTVYLVSGFWWVSFSTSTQMLEQYFNLYHDRFLPYSHQFVVHCHPIIRRYIIIVSGVRLSPLGTAATTGLLYEPQMIDEDDCGEIGGMKIGRGNRSTGRKPAPASLCPPQISLDQTRTRTRAAAVGSQRLTAWAMARPIRRYIVWVADSVVK